jgi:hypothetical protein
MGIAQSAVCQCGHEERRHFLSHEGSCADCECRKFVLPASKVVTCPTCLAGFDNEAMLAEHLRRIRANMV